MSSRAVANEFAKMRHLGIGPVAAVMVIAVTGSSLIGTVAGPDLDPATPAAWNALLAGLSLGIPLISPLLLAILASRQTEIEHVGNGWLLQSTAGSTPGMVCRAKLVALGLVVATVTVAESVLVLAVGRLLIGINAPAPVGHWIGFTSCMLVVNLVVLALHLVLAAKIENQIVCLGIAIVGTLLAVFSAGLPAAVAHLSPWGYYALAQAADYRAGEIVTVPLSYPSIAALAGIAAVLFLLITARFDTQEA